MWLKLARVRITDLCDALLVLFSILPAEGLITINCRNTMGFNRKRRTE